MLVFLLSNARCTEASFLELEFRPFIYKVHTWFIIFGSQSPQEVNSVSLFQMIQQIEMLHVTATFLVLSPYQRSALLMKSHRHQRTFLGGTKQ